MLPSSRTRAHLIADYLRTQGLEAESHHIKTRPWWNLSRERVSDFRNNWKLVFSLKKDDVLYLHKMTDQVDFMFIALLRKWVLRRGFIFDFDDAIFLPSWNRAAKAYLMVKNANAVIVGSHFLQEYALKYNKNSYVLSAPIDTDDVYQVRTKRVEDSRIRIGWTGTPSHFDNMKIILKPLERIMADGYKVVFIQLGGGEAINQLLTSVPGLPVEFTPTLPWDKPKEIVTYLQQFDMGLMPLQKTEANRGKDAWKAKEYMGCGVATLLSNWGENPYVVTNDVDGILAETEEEWYSAFKKLISDAQYREKLGEAGRKRMEEEFSYKAFTPKLLEYIGYNK
jgi:glycosyltransferase involved in cell wall biosynthesis